MMDRRVTPGDDEGGNPMLLLQLLVDGFQLGALYALMAVGFAVMTPEAPR